jgi:Protein of unknown function (DUF1573)
MNKLLCVLYCITSLSCNVERSNQVALLYAKETADLGKVSTRKTYEVTFSVENISNDTVYIKKVNTGCNCTTTVFPSFILPNQSGDIVVGYSPKSDSGYVDRAVVVETDHFPLLKPLHIKAYVYKGEKL